MAPIATVRIAICAAATVVAGAVAATLPARAEAGDTPVSAPEPAALPASTTVDPAALVEEASDAVTDATAEPLGEPQVDTMDVVPADGAEATNTTTPDDDQAAPVTGVEQAEMPDTMPTEGDTSDGIAAPATASTQPVSQAAPANVNVSIRIESAGDDGPVTQTNAVTATVTAAPPAGNTAAPSSAPASSIASAAQARPAVAPAAAPAVASPPAADDDRGTWSWRWDCLSSPDLSAISPTGSDATSIPRNWNWVWNCGGNGDQYQGATSTQYQPSNVNVFIRISSPGNNGPVSQANVVAATATTVFPVTVAAGPLQFPMSSPPISGTPVTAILPPIAAPVIVDPVPQEILRDAGADVGSVVDLVLDAVDDTVDVPRLLSPSLTGAMSALAASQQEPASSSRPATPAGLLPPVARVELAAPVLGETLGAESLRGGPRVAPAARHAATEKPAPRWKAPRPQPIPDVAPTGASVAPATGGGSSGGGIPIFLALPFLAAMLDLARRVTLDRVALPSGFRSRMPENPG